MGSFISKHLTLFKSKLLYPFLKGLRLLILIFFISSSVECWGFATFETFTKAIYIAMHHAVVAYVVVLFYGICPIKLQRLYMVILFALLFMNFIIDLVCVYSFHFTFDQEVPAILLGTNSNEASEFISVFLPPRFWILALCLIISWLILGYFFSKKEFSLPPLLSIAGLSIIAIALSLTFILDSKNWGNVSLTKIYAFSKASVPIHLKDYQKFPVLVKRKESTPDYIVIVIGESFSKFHSSLYSYARETNPRLGQMKEKGELLLFSNVTTPALNTIPVFKTVMSNYKLEYGNDIKWYEAITLPMVMRSADYYTCWFSNQSQKGYHDNVVAEYASLCDTSYFNGNRFAAMGKSDLDGDLILPIKSFVDSTKINKQFHVIHLMGSHPDFSRRYPDNFKHFHPSDYNDYLESQRMNLANYDNSVLYNDYVVSQIMNIYKEKEAIVFYFSDHGMDVYDSRDDYVGHSRDNDNESARVGYNIPFMIYMTADFKDQFPNMSAKVDSMSSQKFCIDMMLPLIMDVAGVSF